MHGHKLNVKLLFSNDMSDCRAVYNDELLEHSMGIIITLDRNVCLTFCRDLALVLFL